MTYSDDDPYYSDDPPPEEPPPTFECDVCGFLRSIYDLNVSQSGTLTRLETKIDLITQTLDVYLKPQFNWLFQIGDKCDNPTIKSYSSSGQGLPAIGLMIAHISRMLEDLRKSNCEKDTIAAIPEHWQIKPESKRPQLVLLCAEKKPDGTLDSAKYPIAIPHYRYSTPRTIPPFTSFNKGSVQGMLVLKDNSKVIVYASTISEAQRILADIKEDIDPDYRTDFSPKIGPVAGTGFQTKTVYPKYAKYFSEGATKMQPDWTVAFSI